MLPAVLDGLFEHPVFVAQPITYRRQLHGRHRVEETCRQAPEPAVPEASVGFLVDQAQPIEVALPGGALYQRIEQEVRDIIGQRAPDQKFH